jgi:hypothetical protein
MEIPKFYDSAGTIPARYTTEMILFAAFSQSKQIFGFFVPSFIIAQILLKPKSSFVPKLWQQ